MKLFNQKKIHFKIFKVKIYYKIIFIKKIKKGDKFFTRNLKKKLLYLSIIINFFFL